MKTANDTERLLRSSYLMLQRLSNDSVRVALETDALRAALRNTLSELTGVDCQELQEEVEAIAHANPVIK